MAYATDGIDKKPMMQSHRTNHRNILSFEDSRGSGPDPLLSRADVDVPVVVPNTRKKRKPAMAQKNQAIATKMSSFPEKYAKV